MAAHAFAAAGDWREKAGGRLTGQGVPHLRGYLVRGGVIKVESRRRSGVVAARGAGGRRDEPAPLACPWADAREAFQRQAAAGCEQRHGAHRCWLWSRW